MCRAPITSATPNYVVRHHLSPSSSRTDTTTTAIDGRLRRLLLGSRRNSTDNGDGSGGGAAAAAAGMDYFGTSKMQVGAGVAVALYVTTGFGLPPELLYWVDNASVVLCTVLVLSYAQGNPLLG